MSKLLDGSFTIGGEGSVFPGLNLGGSFTIGGEGSVFPGLDLGGTITVDTSDPGGWLVSSFAEQRAFRCEQAPRWQLHDRWRGFGVPGLNLGGSFTIGGEGSVFPVSTSAAPSRSIPVILGAGW